MVSAALIPTGSAGYSDIRLQPTTEQPINSDVGGAFRIVCGYSHMNFDDPIVYPGQQGKAHLHAFFGNTKTDYTSTSESIRTAGNSTCNGGIMNRSAYWSPVVIDTSNNSPVKPRAVQVYYKHGVVKVIPRGLRMIAGDMKRTTSVATAWERQSWYECNDIYSNHQDNIIPCGQGGEITMVVSFPACWDGKNLDSPNHKDHMAFRILGVCPATHPVILPTITMKIYYPITKPTGTATWRLSSDNYAKSGQNAGYSAHADFMMGWDEALHKTVVDKCINPAKDCHSHLMGDGRMFY